MASSDHNMFDDSSSIAALPNMTVRQSPGKGRWATADAKFLLWTEVVADLRKCQLCGVGDETEDPVFAKLCPGRGITRVWAYKPKADKKGVLRNQGCFCAVCYRVWEARFKHKYATISELARVKGTDHELSERLIEYGRLCIEQLIAKDSYQSLIDWKDLDYKVLLVITEKKTEFCEPDTELWELNYYIKEKGHPSQNGLGHAIQTVNGVTGVVVPTAPIYKIKQSTSKIAQMQQQAGHSDVQIGNSLDETFNEIAAAFMNIKAVGQVIDERPKVQQIQLCTSPTKQTGSSSSNTAQDAWSSPSLFAGFAVSTPSLGLPHLPDEDAELVATAKAKGESQGKRQGQSQSESDTN